MAETAGNQNPKERKTNNYKRANFFSKLFFWWMLPTFYKGAKRELNLEDLSLPSESHLSGFLGEKLERSWFEEEIAAKKSDRPPSLNRTLIKSFFWKYAPNSVYLFISCVIFRSSSPKILSMLLEYWDKGNTVSKNEAIIYACLLVFIIFCSALMQQHIILRTQKFGMCIRIACSSIVYRKLMRMNNDGLRQAAAGKVVNLLSNDVNRFDNMFSFIHYLWIAPIQIAVTCYLMYTVMGWISIVGLLAIALQTLPVQTYMSKIIAKLRSNIALKTDERILLMNEIISGIEVIKMYAWEQPFEDVITKSRNCELHLIVKTSYFRAVFSSFMVFTERTSLFITLLAYVLLGHPMSASVVFSLVQYFSILKLSFAIWLPNAISMLAEALVAVKRLEEFMKLDERDDLAILARKCYEPVELTGILKNVTNDSKSSFYMDENFGIYNEAFEEDTFESIRLDLCEDIHDMPLYAIELKNVTTKWAEAVTLDGINLHVPRGSLCAVIGSVGSGKSSLLSIMLEELKPTEGTVKVCGKTSYTSQDPWLFLGTVKQNILFGLPYNAKRYKDVVRICALEEDLQHFPRGDHTLVGERGVSLSGGQRARINLARCVYREAEVYLLDDPLSAVDAAVGRQLFEDCITTYLRGKTRMLVTHQLHYLKSADLIVILNNGSIEITGTYDELIASGADYAKLLAALQEDKDDNMFNDVIDEKSRRASVDSWGNRRNSKFNFMSRSSKGEILAEEGRAKGSQGWGIYKAYMTAGAGPLWLGFLGSVLVFAQAVVTGADYWLSFWTNQENAYGNNLEIIKDINNKNSTNGFVDLNEESMYKTLNHYSRIDFLVVYGALIIGCMFFTLGRSVMFYKLCVKCAEGLHNHMFHVLLRGVMQFFNSNPSGRILNRFSKDLGSIDETLPRTLMEMVQIYLLMMGIVVLVSISMPWTLVGAVVIIVLFYYMLKLYLQSARAIRRLEGIGKSPIFSHVNSTINGMTTIRCCEAQTRLIKTFDELQDVHTSSWIQYLFSSASFGWWLDLTVVIYLFIVTFSFVLIDDLGEQAGHVGLAISQTLALNGMLQYGIKQTAEVVNQMTGVERILQYTKIKTEKHLEAGMQTKPDNWPSQGAVNMQNVNLKYSEGQPLVLIDFNLKVCPGWKIGIVGRTGAGKSSLISALFRLTNVDGGIEIDGLNTSVLSLQDLRSSISIIPQEPVLFSASVRYNLDPFGHYNDAKLWEALEAVKLKRSIPSLEYKITQGGSNFSLGQRQLICLARAILKNNKLLILDEATANVDPQTDNFIQQTIRTRFSENTVLTIAHRLNTVMDSHRVLVMDFGRTIEFDHPYVLLQDQHGMFSGMVRETGTKMANQLFNIAKESYFRNNSSSELSTNL